MQSDQVLQYMQFKHYILDTLYSQIWALFLPGFQQSETQTSLLNYRDQLENWNFACSKFKYSTFQ